MKKVLLFVFAAFALFSASFLALPVSFASAATYDQFNYARLNFVLLKYDPFPASPGNVVDVWFKFENAGNQPTQNATFTIVPKYPFYLDAGDSAQKSFGAIPSEAQVIIPYKLRVRPDAPSGGYNVTVNFCPIDSACYSQDFTLNVVDAKTDFDLAVQDFSDTSLSLAISNIGKNQASAVTVRVNGQSGQTEYANILGTLAAGDYTIISVPLTAIYSGGSGGLNASAGSAGPATRPVEAQRSLAVEISYTDSNGNRQVVSKQVAVNLRNAAGIDSGGFSGRGARSAGGNNSNSFDPWFFTTIILVLLGVGYFAYKRYRKKNSG